MYLIFTPHTPRVSYLVTKLFLFLCTIAWLWGGLCFICISQSRSSDWFNKVLFPIHHTLCTFILPIPLLFISYCKKKKKKVPQTRNAVNIGIKYSTQTWVFRRLRIWKKLSYDWLLVRPYICFPFFVSVSFYRDCPVKNYQIHHLQFQQITSESSKILFDWLLIGKSSASLFRWICNH